jgi:hypothetical protein
MCSLVDRSTPCLSTWVAHFTSSNRQRPALVAARTVASMLLVNNRHLSARFTRRASGHVIVAASVRWLTFLIPDQQQGGRVMARADCGVYGVIAGIRPWSNCVESQTPSVAGHLIGTTSSAMKRAMHSGAIERNGDALEPLRRQVLRRYPELDDAAGVALGPPVQVLIRFDLQ